MHQRGADRNLWCLTSISIEQALAAGGDGPGIGGAGEFLGQDGLDGDAVALFEVGAGPASADEFAGGTDFDGPFAGFGLDVDPGVGVHPFNSRNRALESHGAV